MLNLLKTKTEQITEYFKQNADSKKTMFWLDLIAFAESSFFPIPPDPFQIGVTLAKPNRWKLFATHILIFSLLGGAFGYIIGYWFFESFGQPLVNFYHLNEEVAQVGGFFRDNVFWTVFISAVTPIPYKVFTISAGLFHANFIVFMIASFLGRGMRFFSVGYLVKVLGRKYTEKILKHLDHISIAIVVLIILYLLIK